MAKISFQCPSCNAPYSVEDDKAGRSFACKQCGNPVTIPAPAIQQAPQMVAPPPMVAPPQQVAPAPKPAGKPAPKGGAGPTRVMSKAEMQAMMQQNAAPAPAPVPVQPAPAPVAQAPAPAPVQKKVAKPSAGPTRVMSKEQMQAMMQQNVAAQPQAPARVQQRAPQQVQPAPMPVQQPMPVQPQQVMPQQAAPQQPARRTSSRRQAPAAGQPVARPAPVQQAPQPMPVQQQMPVQQPMPVQQQMPPQQPGRVMRGVPPRSGASGPMQPVMQPMQPGMAPMQPGMPPPGYPAKKKSNVGLIVGLVCTVIAIGIGVVAVVIATGDNAENNANTMANAEPPKPKGPTLEEKHKEQLAEQTAALENPVAALRTNMSLRNDLSKIKEAYFKVREIEVFEELNSKKADLLKELADLVPASQVSFASQNMKLLAEIALALKEDGHEAPASLIASFVVGIDEAAQKFQPIRKSSTSGAEEEIPEFKQLAEIAGWQKFEIPSDVRNANYITGFPEYLEFKGTLQRLEQEYKKGYYPKEALDQIEESLKPTRARIRKISGSKDPFARQAALAFSNLSMGTGGGELVDFDTYNYDYVGENPFVYIIELKKEGDDRDSQQVMERFKRERAIIKGVYNFVQEQLVKKMGLKRASRIDLDGKETATAPFTIVLLKDRARLDRFRSRTLYGIAPEGIRAVHNAAGEQLLSYDSFDGHDFSEGYFGDAILIEEVFSYILSFYQMPYQRAPSSVVSNETHKAMHACALLDLGLRNWAAGHSGEGETMTFGTVNHLRVASMQAVVRGLTKDWENATVKGDVPVDGVLWSQGKYLSPISLRDLIKIPKVLALKPHNTTNDKRVALEHIKRHLGTMNYTTVNRVGNRAMAMGELVSSNAVYFFMNYQDGVYRDQFLDFLKQDIQGTIARAVNEPLLEATNYSESPSVLAFMKCFGIAAYDDPRWDTLEQEFLGYIMSLTPEELDEAQGYDDRLE